MHISRILRLSEDLLIIVEIVDMPERIERILPMLDEMVTEGMVTLEKCTSSPTGEAPPIRPEARGVRVNVVAFRLRGAFAQ